MAKEKVKTRKYIKNPDKKYGNPNWSKKDKIEFNNNNPPIIDTNMPQENKGQESPLIPPSESISSDSHSESGQSASIPRDIFSDAMPSKEVLPLEGQVKDNPYAAIPESAVPDAGQPEESIDDGNKPPNIPKNTAQTPAEEPPTPAEIDSQAEFTRKLMLKGYEELHGVGRWIGKINENDLALLHMEGKIDLMHKFPVGIKQITAQEFFAAYNSSIDENIIVSQEFENLISPPLKRIIIKHKLFIGDELALIMIILKDLTFKTALLWGLKKSANLILKSLQETMKKQSRSEKEDTQSATPQSSSGTETENRPKESDVKSDEWREPE